MSQSVQLVLFRLDEQRYALRLSSVDSVVRAVAVTPLPQAPDIVMGVVDVRGQIVPLVNLRRRLRLPERDPDLNDQFILARTAKRPVALVVDAVTGVIDLPGEQIAASVRIVRGLDYVEGIARLDGLVLIHDLDTFLSMDEEQALDEALRP